MNFLKTISGCKKYNVLVLGCDGMLGRELYDRLMRLSAQAKSNIGTVIGLDIRDGIDLTTRHTLGNFFMQSIRFDYCVNCTAYTNTKAAETDARDLDYRLNALAPGYIAESCAYWNTRLVHVSTDYVFSEKSAGARADMSFTPADEPFPCGTYGYDKLLGELNVMNAFGKNSDRYCICRVSWLYGMNNSKSFIHKFAANLVKTARCGGRECEMTSNEYSVPTPCFFAVDYILDVISNGMHGIHHAVPSCNEGGVSRLDFAKEILTELAKYDKRFAGIELKGVERNSYWPKLSALKSTRSSAAGWDECLHMFLEANAGEIIKWADAQV